MQWEWFLFPVVGAFIGAATNDIAIRMLFRPYRAVHLGRLRLPFTPGVIPAQRHIIAENIARTFEQQLFSGGDIHAFLTGPKARSAVEGKVDEMLRSLGPLAAMASGLRGKVVEKLLAGMEEMATDAIAHGAEFDIARRIQAKIDAMDIREVEELVLGFSRKQFQHITLFGGILGGLIGIAQAMLSVWLN